MLKEILDKVMQDERADSRARPHATTNVAAVGNAEESPAETPPSPDINHPSHHEDESNGVAAPADVPLPESADVSGPPSDAEPGPPAEQEAPPSDEVPPPSPEAGPGQPPEVENSPTPPPEQPVDQGGEVAVPAVPDETNDPPPPPEAEVSPDVEAMPQYPVAGVEGETEISPGEIQSVQTEVVDDMENWTSIDPPDNSEGERLLQETGDDLGFDAALSERWGDT